MDAEEGPINLCTHKDESIIHVLQVMEVDQDHSSESLVHESEQQIFANTVNDQVIEISSDNISNAIVQETGQIIFLNPLNDSRVHASVSNNVACNNNSNAIVQETVQQIIVDEPVNDQVDSSVSNTCDVSNTQYKENDLYRLLISKLEGRIILGIYTESKVVDRIRLKELCIVDLLTKNSINYVISKNEFLKLRDQIIELFPTEDPDIYYIPYYHNEANEAISARGCLYNEYKLYRDLLRKAKLLRVTEKPKPTDNQEEPADFNPLTDKNRANYQAADVINEWNSSFKERSTVLFKKRKSLDKVDIYFNSFPCLCPPLGITLLESDFTQLVAQLVESNSIREAHASTINTVFAEKWPTLANKIIHFFKNSRIKEVKDFFATNTQFINEGIYNESLALLLLPLFVTIPKVKCKEKESNSKADGAKQKVITYNKIEIAKTFILHIKNSEDEANERDALEQWLRENKFPVLPYILACGPINNFLNVSIILNGHKYAYSTLPKAVEAIFKCFYALQIWPSLCDYSYSFIDKAIYRLNITKTYNPVNKLVIDLEHFKS